MTLYLRNKKNETLFEAEYYVDSYDDGRRFLEISTAFNIREYSEWLLNQDKENRTNILDSFELLSKLRGWLWEVYFMTERNTADKYDEVLKVLSELFTNIANELNLNYVTD